MNTEPCPTCIHHSALVDMARGDLGDIKAKLIRAQNHPRGRPEHYAGEAKAAKVTLNQCQADLDAHLYECDNPHTARSPHVSGSRGPTPTQVREIAERRRAGHTLQQIAEDLDIARSTVQKHAAAAGLARGVFALDDQPWAEAALCAQTDPEAFFPEKGGSTREAKRVCLACEVRTECLTYALDHDERHGIWGGVSERDRRKLKRQQQGQVAS